MLIPHREQIILLKMKNNQTGIYFIIAGIIFLIAGISFGVIGGLQYVFEDLFKTLLPFYKTRPLHVSLVTTFIILSAVGGVYYYMNESFDENKLVNTGSKLHLILYITVTIIIITCYLLGYFGGREYLEYPPILALPLLVAWILFAFNFYKIIKGKIKGKTPIYIWMWITGIIFFIFTNLEAYLWMFPYFRDNIVKDVTIQWKAMGSMMGAWNMLIYGTAFYVMEKLSGNDKISHDPKTFFFYFLGLPNLLFNWGHHTYIIPHAPWIKTVAYIISMTELLILGNIILNWRKTLTEGQRNYKNIPYRLLINSDIWIFLNLILALLISIPSINKYTHGTHITVAHAMGATIGINTIILLASSYFIFSKKDENIYISNKKTINTGFWLMNISLLIFWISLLAAGIIKGIETNPGSIANFHEIILNQRIYFVVFAISGIGMFIGLILLVIPLLKSFFSKNHLQIILKDY